MKAKVMNKSKRLKEELSKDELKRILELLGEAHSKVIEAQEEIESLQIDNDEELLDNLYYDVEGIEGDLSELDFMGSENPVEDCIEHYEE